MSRCSQIMFKRLQNVLECALKFQWLRSLWINYHCNYFDIYQLRKYMWVLSLTVMNHCTESIWQKEFRRNVCCFLDETDEKKQKLRELSSLAVFLIPQLESFLELLCGYFFFRITLKLNSWFDLLSTNRCPYSLFLPWRVTYRYLLVTLWKERFILQYLKYFLK